MTPSRPQTSVPSALGSIVHRRREQLGLSTREAARRIGISPSYLVAIEQAHNPSTGRAPVPSPRILMAIGRVFDIEVATLLDATGASSTPSVHLLLYQAGAEDQSPLGAARRLFSGRVDAWLEMLDPRRAGDLGSPPDDVLARNRWPLGSEPSGPVVFEKTRTLRVVRDVVADVRVAPGSRLGMVFGASSAVLRSIENPSVLLESEASWEQDVAAESRAAFGVEPCANVCVYRETDIQELAGRIDPLATVLELIRAHPHVAVQEDERVMTGTAALETILTRARPPGTSTKTWESLARAAAAGLARAPTAHAGGDERSDAAERAP